jgi:hypothetical protein
MSLAVALDQIQRPSWFENLAGTNLPARDTSVLFAMRTLMNEAHAPMTVTEVAEQSGRSPYRSRSVLNEMTQNGELRTVMVWRKGREITAWVKR